MSSNGREIDKATGVETTGHEWDGLRELNNPLPRWWLWSFYVCILWGIGYMVAYPAWPLINGYTKGMLGYSQRSEVSRQVAAGQAAQGQFRAELAKASLADIEKNPELMRFATAGGKTAFATNCAPCHGRGAAGAAGYPNLNDDDWLWGGRMADIEKSIMFGIRSNHKDSRLNDMPKFGIDKLLTPEQIDDVAEYTLSLSGKAGDKTAAGRGGKIFTEQCVACHGPAGKGNRLMGAPDLTDAIWLYGSRKGDVVTSINTGRGGVMPHWTGRLDPVTIKALTVYVYSLGGGQK